MRHFSGVLDPWEADKLIVLTLAKVEDGLYTFRNHVSDSPRWSYLTGKGPDEFNARSEIFSSEGKLSEITIDYKRRN